MYGIKGKKGEMGGKGVGGSIIAKGSWQQQPTADRKGGESERNRHCKPNRFNDHYGSLHRNRTGNVWETTAQLQQTAS